MKNNAHPITGIAMALLTLYQLVFMFTTLQAQDDDLLVVAGTGSNEELQEQWAGTE